MVDFRKFMQIVMRKFNDKLNVSASAAMLIAVFCLYKARAKPNLPLVKISNFMLVLQKKLVEEVIYDGSHILFRCVNQAQWLSTQAEPMIKGKELLKALMEYGVPRFQNSTQIYYNEKQMMYIIMSIAALSYTFGIFASHLINSNRLSNKSMLAQSTGVKFSNIYGLDHAKKQLQQIIEYLQDPLKYRNVGARLRRGVMIYGPPGTGKTMLAKATATESNVNFLYCSATEFIEVYVGTGPKRVRELFKKARQSSPAIIFIDEIDSIAYKRKNQNFGTETVLLNQLLTELDGFKENENIVVIAATNRIQILDEALLRSGRFDIKIEINLPSENERKGIMGVHLQNKKHQVSSGMIDVVAKNAYGFSGADMENITNESAYIAIEKQQEFINDADFQEALKKITMEKQHMKDQILNF
ncbi:unnamed protein product (macronuclear) [Paramecium tetraurelia]|uniref:AAA+ ATPase domain-containing protein n=1 Tax=Paramecium tetraurelia TaxID=5888 RepID=A0DJ60_PARTE|nr:uncharacterized protein GSPATT00017434001 [Paramecium tetraurelia]CAK83077.1 unnamed protein product [Paramecium tetraurelia]|eukprot:XP_001450474.1 hypothetical protein (macronuclear) [Paramecium tetraurelia strain d4-2]